MHVERRTARRFDISELIFVSSAKETRAGLLRNISRLGADVEFAEPLGRVQHGFAEGEAIELKIDGLGELPGTISRITDKGVAVTFQIDDQQQEMLRAEIQEAFDAP
jgi:hypothetical protein